MNCESAGTDVVTYHCSLISFGTCALIPASLASVKRFKSIVPQDCPISFHSVISWFKQLSSFIIFSSRHVSLLSVLESSSSLGEMEGKEDDGKEKPKRNPRFVDFDDVSTLLSYFSAPSIYILYLPCISITSFRCTTA